MDFLDTMATHSRERAGRARAVTPLDELRKTALAAPGPPRLRLSATGFDVIAEVKLRAPSAGRLSTPLTDDALVERARQYADAGAAAISVLTEDSRFEGSLDHLRLVAAAIDSVPAMRKDFLVDPYQVYEARLAGAGGVLLIARMLDDETLDQMLSAASDCGLFVLLEAFDGDDLVRIGRVAGTPDLLAGLNSRNLATLDIDATRFERLRERFPRGVPAVAESGLSAPDDVARVAALGYDVALVGSALMRTDSPGPLVGAMLDAGRAAR